MHPTGYPNRMSRSMSHKHKHIAEVNGITGILNLQLRQACEYVSFHSRVPPLNAKESYVLSVILKKIFLFKCTIPILRMNNLLLNLLLPPLISYCLALYRSDRPPRSLIEPTIESIVISAFPIAWFFSFLYYTELGSLIFVLATILAAGRGAHWLAALVRS